MAKMEMLSGVSEDRQSAVINLLQDGVALGHIIYDASTLEQFIHQLAALRASLPEQVAPTLDPGSRIDAQIAPAWQIPAVKSEHGRLLLLRHPGLGWLGFALGDKHAAEIAEWLTKDLPTWVPLQK